MDHDDAGRQQGLPNGPGTGQPSGALPPGDTNATGAVPYTPVLAPRKRSRTPLIVGVALLVLLVAAALGAYWLFNRAVNAPAVAVERLLPANTLAYLTINPSPHAGQKEALDKLGAAFQSQVGFKQAWARLTQQAGGTGASDAVDFSSLSSYLGENLTVAMLPPSTSDLEKLKDSAGNEQSVLGDIAGRNLLGIVDLDLNPLNKKPLPSSLDKQTGDLSKASVAEKYRDIEIRRYVTGTNTLYFTLLEGTSTAIVGMKVEPLRTAIDQLKDNKGLKESATFTQLSAQLPADRIATVYVNLAEVYSQGRAISPDAFSDLSSLQDLSGAMFATLRADPDGIQLDINTGVYTTGAGVQINPLARPDVKMLADVPADSAGFLLGTDLRSVAQSFLNMLRKGGPSSEEALASNLRDLQQRTGVDLEQDVLPWMGGDYALSVSNPSADDVTALATVFQIKLNAADRDKALQAVEKFASPDTNSENAKISAAGGTFYSLDPSSRAVLGVSGDRMMYLFGSDVTLPRERITRAAASLGKGIGTTDNWREIARHLPVESNVLAYLDLAVVRHIYEADLADSAGYEQDVAPFVRPFKYLLLGSASQPNAAAGPSRNHTVFFVGIGR